MRWLKGISITLGFLIFLGVAASVTAAIVRGDRVSEARETGEAAGYTLGSAEGYEEGGAAGYESGVDVGHDEGSAAGYEDGQQVGYDSGYEAGFELGAGVDQLLRDPTYAEVQLLLAEATEDTAEELNNEVELEGIRAAYVSVHLAADLSYGLVGFETVDEGFILYEPQAGQEVEAEVGKRFSVLNDYFRPAYDDTITGVTVIW